MELIDTLIGDDTEEEETEQDREARIAAKAWLKPYQYQKGQSGNPNGRPKGAKTMKQWLKERFERMTDEEREEFLQGMNKIDLFRMAEGNPTEDRNVSITVPKPILGGMTQAEVRVIEGGEQSTNTPENPNNE